MTPTKIRTLARNPFVAATLLTLALGATVAVSWLVVGGSVAFRGPIPALSEMWLPLYALQAVLAAMVGFAASRFTGGRGLDVVVLVGAAWVGEYVVLFFGGRLFAGELVPDVAGFYWLIGTGGPVQPIAAVLGGWLALRRQSSRRTTG
jgi:hypothetical protein